MDGQEKERENAVSSSPTGTHWATGKVQVQVEVATATGSSASGSEVVFEKRNLMHALLLIAIAAAVPVGSQQCTVFSQLGSFTSGSTDGNSSIARLSSPKGTAPDTNNSLLYIADEFNHRIRIAWPNLTLGSLAGSTFGFADGSCGAARFRNPTGVAFDSATGALYISDWNNHRIRGVNTSFSPCTVFTVAGSGVPGTAAGPASAATFSSPYSLAAWRGDVFVSDSYAGVRWINNSGFVTNLMSGASGYVDGPCAQARTQSTRGVAIARSAAGTTVALYFIDINGNRVRSLFLNPCVVSTLAGSALGMAGWADGAATAALFNNPWSGWLHEPSASYIVADSNNNRLRRVLLSNGSTTTLAGTGVFIFQAGLGNLGIPGGPSLGYPRGISPAPPAFGPSIWAVAEGNAGSVRLLSCPGLDALPAGGGGGSSSSATPTPWPAAGAAYPTPGTPSHTPTGAPTPSATPSPPSSSPSPTGPPIGCTVSTLAGSPGMPGSVDGALGTSRIANASALAFSNASGGVVYLAEARGHAIRAFSLATNTLGTYAGMPGTAGLVNGAALGTARFSAPGGLALNGSILLVADTGNHVIRAISGGVVTTLAGQGYAGYADGAAAFAVFNSPTGLAFQAATGHLYLADTGNHRIRALRGGWVSFLAGAGSGAAGPVDGAGAFAQFVAPRGLLVSGAWLLVVDGTRRVRKVHTVSGLSVAFSGGGAWGSTGAAVNGPGPSAAFWNATALAWAVPPGGGAGGGAASALLVADNSALRWVGPSGAAGTLAGALGGPLAVPVNASLSLNGYGAAASFNGAVGLAVNPATGVIYVGEGGGCVLRAVSCAVGALDAPPGASPSPSPAATPTATPSPSPTPDPAPNTCVVNALAGSGSVAAGGSGTVDGSGTSALFLGPSAAALPGGALAAALPPGTFVAYGRAEYCLRFIAPNGTVWRYTGVCGTAGSANGVSPTFNAGYGGIVADPASNLWLADQYSHQIRRVAFLPPLGASASLLAGRANATPGFADGTGTGAAFAEPWGLALAPSGMGLYVTDHLNHRLRYVTIPGGAVSTLAGSSGAGAFAEGLGALAAFNLPRGLALSGNGDALFIADFGNLRVRRYSTSSGRVDTVVGTGVAAFVSAGPAAGATLSAPQALALHPSLGLLIGENVISCALLAFDLSTFQLTPLVAPTWFHCFPAIGPAPLGRFNYPAALLVGADNATIIVGDTNSHSWRTVTGCPGQSGSGASSSSSTTTTTTTSPSPFASTTASPLPPPVGTCTLSTLASQAPLGQPQDAVPAPGGGAFVSSGAGALLRVWPNGTTVALTGAGGSAGYAEGPPGAAAFNFSMPASGGGAGGGGPGPPSLAGLALAATTGTGPSSAGGVLLVADPGNCRLRALALDTLLTTPLAGSGACQFADGTPSLAAFRFPSGLALAPPLLFIADTGNHRVRVLPLGSSTSSVQPAGNVTTLAGTGVPGGTDGPAGTATLGFPRGLAVQGTGEGEGSGAAAVVFVSEAFNRIRAVRVVGGWVTTLAGSGGAGYANSPFAWLAQFSSPWFLGLEEYAGVGGGMGCCWCPTLPTIACVALPWAWGAA